MSTGTLSFPVSLQISQVFPFYIFFCLFVSRPLQVAGGQVSYPSVFAHYPSPGAGITTGYRPLLPAGFAPPAPNTQGHSTIHFHQSDYGSVSSSYGSTASTFANNHDLAPAAVLPSNLLIPPNSGIDAPPMAAGVTSSSLVSSCGNCSHLLSVIGLSSHIYR